jgi:hypothetical protein
MYANGGYGNNNMNQIPVTQFGNGGSHEDNPLGGIPQGMGANGKMNLVEEGELKIPDPRPQSEGGFFIVSADPSMKITKTIAEDYNLPKKLVGKSVLKAAESILRKGTGREGDTIEENSINIDLSNFLDAHEELTAMAEAKEEGKFMEELAKLEEKYPEYMQALMGAPEPSMGETPMDPSMQGQQGPSPEEQAMMEQEMMAQQGGMPPGAMPMGAPGMDPAMMGGMPPEAMGMPMMYGGPMEYKKGGNMIKRADGSYSQRGLWDNIRANKGSGKKPTKEMLKQEKKIKGNSKMYGSKMYENGGPGDPPKKSYKQPVVSDNTRVVTSAPYYPSQKELQTAIKNKEEFDALKKTIIDDPAGHIAMPGNPNHVPMATDSIRMYYAQPGRGYTVDYFNSPTTYGTMNTGGFPNVNEAVEAVQKGRATYNPGKYYDEDSTYHNIVLKQDMNKEGDIVKERKYPYLYKNGGSFDNPGFKALPKNVQDKIKGNSMGYGGDMYEYGSTMGNMYFPGGVMDLPNTFISNSPLSTENLINQAKTLNDIGLSEEEKQFDPANQFSYQKSLGTAVGQALPAAANLAMGFFTPSKEYEGALGREDYVEFPEILPGQNLVDINQNFAGARNALEAVVGTSPGAYMSNVQTLYSKKNEDLAALYTELRNTNAKFKAEEERINSAVRKGNLTAAQAELQLEEAAEAAKAAMLGKGIQQIGDIATAGEQNKLGMMYNQMYAPNYKFDYQGNPFAGMFKKDQQTS